MPILGLYTAQTTSHYLYVGHGVPRRREHGQNTAAIIFFLILWRGKARQGEAKIIMSRTFKHNKDGDYAESDTQGSLSIGRKFAGNKDKQRKRKDAQFRKQRRRELSFD